jgi:short-subunit dehydrogenase
MPRRLATKKRSPRRRRTATAAAPGRVLVTGASAGIGADIAREFAARGHDLVLVARSRDKLDALAAELRRDHARTASVIALDLAKPAAPQKLFAALAAQGIAVEILVNNAGVMDFGRFTEIDAARHVALIELNVRSLTALTHMFLPPMQAKGRGRILNVASIAAFQPIPMLATYAGTKAFVLSLTEALSEELKGTGVTVTALCPGLTDTNMVGSVKRASAKAARLPGFLLYDAGLVARAGVEACLAGTVVCVPGLVNELTALSSRNTPKWLLRTVWGMAARQLA